MNVLLDRFKTSPDGTFGMMTLDGLQLCFTVERPYSGEHPCIPAGTYHVEKYLSPKHGDVWQVMNVPRRFNIEIHASNLASELLGCIAPGERLGAINDVPAVLDSQKAFAMLKSRLNDEFELTVTDVPA